MRAFALAILAGAPLLASSGPDPPPSRSRSGDLALVGGIVYVSPTEAPIPDGVILVRGGRITAVGSRASVQVPPSADVLDCSGLTVTAGFTNSHVHLFGLGWAEASAMPAAQLARSLEEAFTRYGFTAVFDTGSPWENTRRIRERVESGEVAGPRIRSTGEALVAPGAMPSNEDLRAFGSLPMEAPEISDAAQAVAASKALLARGVDGIKVHLKASPETAESIPEAAIRAAVAEAHRAGKVAFVHPETNADVLSAARSGADVIAHTTPESGPWDTRLLEEVLKARVALTPTLTLWKSYGPPPRGHRAESAVGQLQDWIGAGGIVLFGTDLGAVSPDPRPEYIEMARAGMSFRQILASLTTAPAERFDESDERGLVAPGYHADLVVLKEDPARDVAALAGVRYTLRGGEILFAAE